MLRTFMVLHVCYSVASEGRIACLGDLAGQFTRPGIDFRETLNEMLSYPHDPALKRGWRATTGLQTATHPVVSEKAQEMLDKESYREKGSCPDGAEPLMKPIVAVAGGTLKVSLQGAPVNARLLPNRVSTGAAISWHRSCSCSCSDVQRTFPGAPPPADWRDCSSSPEALSR